MNDKASRLNEYRLLRMSDTSGPRRVVILFVKLFAIRLLYVSWVQLGMSSSSIIGSRIEIREEDRRPHTHGAHECCRWLSYADIAWVPLDHVTARCTG